ncbi:DUF3037 domain-containing protein [Virgibacillus halodenitrificans]|uniref:DUF3037 domain-containing protein n=1 Tax=Virgibacillus halodenitrificans TaxID=1482 RepID=UPI0013696C53|nr:DUF3037 domain-containing protein [Virgibacillus halodenitrificans]MYL45073.1 DUF3037 domain-containing protein [Virgibacillus halodenitrificans]
MNKPIYFAVCRYIPDILRGESINVGILVHIPDNKSIKFYKTKNLSRIRNFDDEVELDVLKALLESIDFQFNNNRASELNGLNSKNFLENELVYFVNQIQFSEIRVLNSDTSSLQTHVNDLIDMYLYYDKKKSDRITANRVKSLASKMVSASYLKDKINRNPDIKNNFNQRPFDFTIDIDGNKVLFKAISFDYKSRNKFYNEIKSFLYDIEYATNSYNNDIKVIINNTDRNEDYERIAYDLLRKKVDVFTLEEFDKYIFNNTVIQNKQLEFFN